MGTPARRATPVRQATRVVRQATRVSTVGPKRLGDLATLFGTSKTTSSCYCMWFLVPAKECQAGWSGANKVAFERMAATDRHPVGLLAYRGGEPVGWCALGPRSRYARALRSAVLRAALAEDRDPGVDDTVWLVPCFYVRRDMRGLGVTRALLEAAVREAGRRGATAIEGFPLSGEKRRGTGEAYLGVEPLFASCGFTAVARPTPGRVVMRRVLV
jgi:GNAT superfamily N-acetyltransferase